MAEGKRWKKKVKKLPGVESCLALRTGLFSLTSEGSSSSLRRSRRLISLSSRER